MLDLTNYAAVCGHCLNCQCAFFSWSYLHTLVRTAVPHHPRLGPGGSAKTPVCCQTRPAPAHQWGWTDPWLCGANCVQ